MVIKGQVNMRKTCRKSDSESVKRISGEMSAQQVTIGIEIRHPRLNCLESNCATSMILVSYLPSPTRYVSDDVTVNNQINTNNNALNVAILLESFSLQHPWLATNALTPSHCCPPIVLFEISFYVFKLRSF
jgi:hypothetical protein